MSKSNIGPVGPDPLVTGSEAEPLIKQQSVYDALPTNDDDSTHLDEEAGWLQEQRLLHKAMHWFLRPSVYMIGLALFFFTFGLSSAEASRQLIQYKLACNSVTKNTGAEVCDPVDAQVLLSTLQQALQVTQGIATVIALAKVPSLSDKYGRKIFITLLVAFMLIGKICRYLVTSRYPVTMFGLMIACEIVSSAFGGLVTMLSLCNCYAADISEPDQRTHFLGIILTFFFVGLSLGPMCGNFLLSYFPESSANGKPSVMYGPNLTSHEFLPLRFEILMIVILLLFSMFVLPESRSSKARRMSRSASKSLTLRSDIVLREESTQKRFLSIFNIFRPLRIIFYPKDYVNPSRYDSIVAHRIAVATLILLDCAFVAFAMSLGEIFLLFSIYKHKMTAQDLGYLMFIGCSCRAFYLTVLSPILNKKVFVKFFGLQPHKRRFDLIDYGMVSIAFLGELLGVIFLAISPNKRFFLASGAFAAIGSLASPALNSATIKFFPESKIGEVFGAMALAKNVFNISFPLIFLGIYKYSLRQWHKPEIVLYLVAGIFFVMFLAASNAIWVLEKEDAAKERRESSSE